MEVFNQLITGFSVALQPMNLLYCFLGTLIGTLVGVLPGLGPVAAMSLLLPATFHTTPEASIIMLAGIYYGSMYGGSTTSILMNIPGEAASIVTCLDGHEMAKRGRAGAALGMAAFGSFIAATVALIGLQLLSGPLVDFALKFGSPEYFALMVLGMTILTFLASASMLRAIMMALFGLILGCIGQDTISGSTRFTLGIPELLEGLGIVPVVMGLFGISEVLLNLEHTLKAEIFSGKVKGLFPTLKDWSRSKWAIARGTVMGFFLGILPGGGGTIAAFASYAIEKRFSAHPEEFGKGAVEGVAGPESANNAAAQGAFIPLLSLGIPSNVVMAMLIGALIIHGITPGPLLLEQHPQLFWGVVVSMYVGNMMLLVLNLPLISIWVKVLKIPYSILFPLILLLCFLGAFTINNSITDVWLMFAFGILGYLMKKLSLESAPMVLAFVLGPMLETALRQSLIKSDGSFSIFFTRPISASFLIISALLLLVPLLPKLGRKRPGAIIGGDDDI
ncbi:MAG TPA: tripartite tricarboxylate transporter permease [Syntrophorhabdaceae bacterium]|nr:tripartite tricarboxylate transporter permease [Syntrophorhabdaceae bacterium]